MRRIALWSTLAAMLLSLGLGTYALAGPRDQTIYANQCDNRVHNRAISLMNHFNGVKKFRYCQRLNRTFFSGTAATVYYLKDFPRQPFCSWQALVVSTRGRRIVVRWSPVITTHDVASKPCSIYQF